MTPEGRAELRKLLAKATDRPWIAEYSGPTGNCVIPHDAQSTLEAVAFTRILPAWHDAELIAAAVNALPALLDALDQADDHAKFLESVADINDTHAGLWQARATKAEAALDRVRELSEEGKCWGGADAIEEFIRRLDEILDGDS
ncbi:hypothetical protein SAMN04490240_4106 [Rhodococcus pyridinivorans]|nr:hypothetical protein SAMN04490240_4106 [Rhodococcus pyridinivorans]